MKRVKTTLIVLLAIISAGTAEAQMMIQKGSMAAGAHFGHFRMDSDNSEFLLMVNPINASGSITSIAPFFEYAYRDDRSVGIKFQYMGGNAAIDSLTLELPGEGMTFNLTDMGAAMNRYSVFLYHRNYFALDRRSRVGLICEESLSYSRTRTSGDRSNPDSKYAIANKVNVAFSPGLIFFVMNNVSASFSLSLANASYNKTRCYADGAAVGQRSNFGARLGIDVTGINFGIGFHF